MVSGTCPECRKKVEEVVIEAITIKGSGASWKGLSYLCPSCNSVLGVGIDPISLEADLIEKIRQVLRQG